MPPMPAGTVDSKPNERPAAGLNSPIPSTRIFIVMPAAKAVTTTSNGFYFFQFKMEVAMEEVIEGGPWLFQASRSYLRGGSRACTVASGVERPLYQDTITRACARLDFAHVCVMLDISSTLLKQLIIMMLKEDGNEVPCKVEVEYEWVPPKCKHCMSLGHTTATCPESKKTDKPLVAVYVQKRPTMQPPPSGPTVETKAVCTVQHTAEKDKEAEQSNFID
ncbi:hypothetical protein Sango_3074400 [Sesamum angolense]|uniref:Zinc knuckle CX2CX4HX4C domain-containing protein n=1 Tax=Sesamum angolense TaxID=2727404 RepID=A0AAE1T9C4_9LAMI|nr:hypothetical protein Sango_3074400 [Sesamum angolense]